MGLATSRDGPRICKGRRVYQWRRRRVNRCAAAASSAARSPLGRCAGWLLAVHSVDNRHRTGSVAEVAVHGGGVGRRRHSERAGLIRHGRARTSQLGSLVGPKPFCGSRGPSSTGDTSCLGERNPGGDAELSRRGATFLSAVPRMSYPQIPHFWGHNPPHPRPVSGLYPQAVNFMWITCRTPCIDAVTEGGTSMGSRR
jgi:hypothetical protein